MAWLTDRRTKYFLNRCSYLRGMCTGKIRPLSKSAVEKIAFPSKPDRRTDIRSFIVSSFLKRLWVNRYYKLNSHIIWNLKFAKYFRLEILTLFSIVLSIAPDSSRILSARVDFPWSTWATILAVTSVLHFLKIRLFLYLGRILQYVTDILIISFRLKSHELFKTLN